MKILLLLSVALLSMAPPVGARGDAASPETNIARKQIDAAQQTIGRSIHDRDFSTLERFWSPQMIVNAPENTIRTREDVFADMRSGGLNYSSLKETVESFKVFGDIAIEMGHEDFVMASGPAAGKSLQRRFTNIWRTTGVRWVRIARQATILGVDAASVYESPGISIKPQ